MIESEFEGMAPVNFFQLRGKCRETKEKWLAIDDRHLLPLTDRLCGEEAFADFYIGWSKEGISTAVDVKKPFYRVIYPEIAKGDSVELFIDTRDVKSSGYNTRFCHHFFFLPEAADAHIAGEITRFRTEESHAHCDPDLLEVKSKIGKSGYILKIFIPSQCLHGYDSEQFDRLGFTYRINRPDGPSQHFSVISEEYQIEQQPSLWSSLQLER